MSTSGVIYNGNYIMDISDTTATPETVLKGQIFYAANGVRSVGTASGGDENADDPNWRLTIAGEEYYPNIFSSHAGIICFNSYQSSVYKNSVFFIGPYVNYNNGSASYNDNYIKYNPEYIKIGNNVKNGSNLFARTDLRNGVKIPNSIINCQRMYYKCIYMVDHYYDIPKTIEDVSNMFYGCHNFNQFIDIREFLNLKKCDYFYFGINEYVRNTNGVLSITNLPNTVTSINGLFRQSEYNENFEIPNLVESCHDLFMGCPNFDKNIFISNTIIDCSNMFYGCNNLNKNISISESVSNCSYMFYMCRNLYQNIELPINAINCSYMFSGVPFNGGNINIYGNVKNCSYMFSGTGLNSSNVNIIIDNNTIRDYSYMFSSSSLNDVRFIMPNNGNNYSHMFYMSQIPINLLDNNNIIIDDNTKNCSDMFLNCNYYYNNGTGIVRFNYFNNDTINNLNFTIIINKNICNDLNIMGVSATYDSYCWAYYPRNKLFNIKNTFFKNIINSSVSHISSFFDSFDDYANYINNDSIYIKDSIINNTSLEPTNNIITYDNVILRQNFFGQRVYPNIKKTIYLYNNVVIDHIYQSIVASIGGSLLTITDSRGSVYLSGHHYDIDIIGDGKMIMSADNTKRNNQFSSGGFITMIGNNLSNVHLNINLIGDICFGINNESAFNSTNPPMIIRNAPNMIYANGSRSYINVYFNSKTAKNFISKCIINGGSTYYIPKGLLPVTVSGTNYNYMQGVIGNYNTYYNNKYIYYRVIDISED